MPAGARADIDQPGADLRAELAQLVSGERLEVGGRLDTGEKRHDGTIEREDGASATGLPKVGLQVVSHRSYSQF